MDDKLLSIHLYLSIRHLGWLHFSVMADRVAVNKDGDMSLWDADTGSFGSKPRTGNSWISRRCISVLQKTHSLTALVDGLAYALVSGAHLPLFPWLSFAFLVMVIPSGLRWNPNTILIRILLMAEDAKWFVILQIPFFPELLSASSSPRDQEFRPQSCV